jgi:PKHD-type hydroxylase
MTGDGCKKIIAGLDTLTWVPGISGSQSYSEKVKGNKEITYGHHSLAKGYLDQITGLMLANKSLLRRTFIKHIANPKFNLYQDGGFYGKHADSGFMGEPAVRTDFSMTLFLSEPDEYEGGELELSYPSGSQLSLKEPAGTLVAYPSGVMHQVLPVTRGRRIAFVCWCESHIQNPQMRDILIEITALCDEMEKDKEIRNGQFHTAALNVKHNLFRIWWKNEG